MTRISKGMYIDIAKFRLTNNLLQKDLSDNLGVTRGYMSMPKPPWISSSMPILYNA